MRSAGVVFTETMEGHVAEGAATFEVGRSAGRAADGALMFRVTIRMEDLDAFIADPEHRAAMTGTIDGWGTDGVTPIEDAEFQLFARDEDGNRQMRYRFRYQDASGRSCLFTGYKDVRNDRTIDVWPDTTTLFVTISDAESGEPFARGVFVIRIPAFARQLVSFRSLNAGPVKGALALARFNVFFLGNLWDEYAPRWLRLPRRASAG